MISDLSYEGDIAYEIRIVDSNRVPLNQRDLSELVSSKDDLQVFLERIRTELCLDDYGANRDGNIYYAFVTAYDSSISSYCGNCFVRELSLSGVSYLLSRCCAFTPYIKSKQTIVKNGQILNTYGKLQLIPRSLLKKAKEIIKYTITTDGFSCEQAYSVVYANGIGEDCYSISELRDVLKKN